MMYTTSAYGYIPKFGKRLLLPGDSDADVYGRTSATSSTTPRPRSRPTTASCAPCRCTPARRSGAGTRSCSSKIGEDPENPPDNYPDLFKLVPKFKAAEDHPVASSRGWPRRRSCSRSCTSRTSGTRPASRCSARTSPRSGSTTTTGKEVFAVIEEGFKSGCWDPQVHEHRQRARRVQDLRRRQRGDDPLEREPHPDRATWRDPSERRHAPASGLPAGHERLAPGGPDGLGVSKFSASRTPAGAGRATTSAPRSRSAAATTVKDSTGALVLFPVARTSVVAGSGRHQGPAAPARLRRAEQVPDRPLVHPVRHDAGVQRGHLEDDRAATRRGEGPRAAAVKGCTGHHHQVPVFVDPSRRAGSFSPAFRNDAAPSLPSGGAATHLTLWTMP